MYKDAMQNMLMEAMFHGIQIYIGQGMILSNNTVNAPGQVGFLVDSTALGSAALTCNTAETSTHRMGPTVTMLSPAISP